MGQAISGRLRVEDQAVHLVVDLPWLLYMLATTMKAVIEREGRLLVER